MSSQQQEWIALIIVFLVAGLSVFRWLKRRRRAGTACSHCESSCTNSDKTNR